MHRRGEREAANCRGDGVCVWATFVTACAHRLRTSSVLVVGARGLAAELCKNVVLAGVRSLTVLDPEPLGHHDVASRFLGRAEGENVSTGASGVLTFSCGDLLTPLSPPAAS